MKKSSKMDLYEEALDVLQQSEILKATTVWQAAQVDKICEKYSDTELDILSWDEKEVHMKEVEELYGRLIQSTKELKELDQRYQTLREKVNQKYGPEVMPPVSGNISGSVSAGDEVDML